MGILFVLIVWIAIFAVIAVLLGVIGIAIVYPFLPNERRNRILLLTFLTPSVGIASFIGSSIVAMIILSKLINIDVGFGDYWKTPLPNNYKVESVDISDYGTISKDVDHPTEGIVTVRKINVVGDSVIGLLSDNEYIMLDTRSGKVSNFASLEELQKKVGANISLVDISDYYWAVRKNAYIFIGIICLIFTLVLLTFMWKKGLSRNV